MSKPQIIYQNGKPAFAVLPWKHYELFRKRVDEADLTDEELFDLAETEDDEVIPMYVSERLSAGEHPIRVFREYRDMTQKDLAEKAGISSEYVSQIEGRKKQGTVDTLKSIAGAPAGIHMTGPVGTVDTLKSIAGALGVDLDDLV